GGTGATPGRASRTARRSRSIYRNVRSTMEGRKPSCPTGRSPSIATCAASSSRRARRPEAPVIPAPADLGDPAAAEAIVAEPGRGPAERAGALTTLTILGLERPARIGPSTVAGCERLLHVSGLPGELQDRALAALGAVVYGRPDFVGEGTVSA